MERTFCTLFAHGYHSDPVTGAFTGCIDFSWIKFLFLLLVFYVIANLFITIFFPQEGETDDFPLYTEYARLNEDKVTLNKWDDGRTFMTYEGNKKTFHFLFWRGNDGKARAQRTDAQGNFYRSPVIGSDRYSMGRDQSLFDHITYTINTEDK